MVDKHRSGLAARLGQNIMRGRKALGLTQDQVAGELKVEPETISRFERGVTLPSITTLEKIASILRTTMGELLAEGSPRQFTDTEQLAALLETLSAADRALVVEFVGRLSTHMVKRGAPKRKASVKVAKK